jgi:flagellar biosynthesis protein FliQ
MRQRFVKLLLAAVVLPFLIAGILGGTKAAMWITRTSPDERSFSFLAMALFLVPACILAGALLAYAIIIFTLSRVSPRHPLLVFTNVETGLGRHLNPALRAVHTFATRLASRR